MAKRYSKRALEEAKKIPGFMWNNVKRSARVGRDIVNAINAFDRGAGSDPVPMPAGPQTPPPVAMPSYLGPEAADANRMAAYKRWQEKYGSKGETASPQGFTPPTLRELFDMPNRDINRVGDAVNNAVNGAMGNPPVAKRESGAMELDTGARSAAINANSRNFNRAAATERYNSKYGPGGSRTTPLDEGMMTPFLGEVKKRIGDLGRTAKGVYDQTVDYWSGPEGAKVYDKAKEVVKPIADYWTEGEGRDALREVPGVIKGYADAIKNNLGGGESQTAATEATPAAPPAPTNLGPETTGADVMSARAARDAAAQRMVDEYKAKGFGSYLGPTAAGAARVADFRARATENARSKGMQDRFDRQAALGEREKDRGLARDVAGAQTEADIAKFTSGERAAVIKMQGDFAMADARGKNDMRTAVFKSVMESTADVNKAFEAVNQLEQQDAAAGGAGGAQGGGTTTPTSTDMNGDGVPDTLEEQATYAEQKAAQIQKTLLAGSYNGVALTPDQRKTLQTELAIAQKAARYRPTKGA